LKSAIENGDSGKKKLGGKAFLEVFSGEYIHVYNKL